MPEVPESDLQHTFNRLVDATPRNASARKTAVRWFNRLYYLVLAAGEVLALSRSLFASTMQFGSLLIPCRH